MSYDDHLAQSDSVPSGRRLLEPLRSRSTMNAGGLIALAIVVLVLGLPLAFVLTTIVTLTVLASSPSYQSRTTDGRVIGTLFNPCTGDTWRITDTGAERS